jgi:adenine-specific DNA methylase
MANKKMLIEHWLPLETLSAECMRERGASSALPPLYFLHVWWARRPLLISRVAILASVLPAWSEDWPEHLLERYPSDKMYHKWFKRACGILGDPVHARKLLDYAKAKGERISNPYDSERAFKVSPNAELIEEIRDLTEYAFGKRNLTVLDAFAGGGSIPFEARRYGFNVVANELNPVACVILKATLDYPFRYGEELLKDLKRYGNEICSRVQERLKPFFTDVSTEYPKAVGVAYLWARTVKCPYTGKPIPLSPNWWLRKKGKKKAAVRPVFDPSASEACFEILRGKQLEGYDPSEGTVSRGKGVSPWAHNQPVTGKYIKQEAQAGRMGQQLYAVAIKKSRGMEFRAPTAEDFVAVKRADNELEKKLPEWDAKGFVPYEDFPYGYTNRQSANYGVRKWVDLFTSRQLLALCTFLEEMDEQFDKLKLESANKAQAIKVYLEFVIGKAVNYNSRMSVWHPTRSSMANAFDRHDYSFKWSHGEFDASRNLYQWGLDQIVDAYRGLGRLATGYASDININKSSAADLAVVESDSIDHICIDPPYYDNVFYAESSDFFYVWLKRVLGDTFPKWLHSYLTNKDDEATANYTRFEYAGKKKHILARQDYERKMAASFRELHRVLRLEGTITVMFTHKQIDAWDTLATSLLNAGFEIESSWPVHTESEHSLHQAKKNAAKSTILLTCRKREVTEDKVWWEDIKGDVRRQARKSAEEFEAQGITGVDLYIATFGPTLSILSKNWPVYTSEVDEDTGEPKKLQPETALDLARAEVVALRKKGLLLGREVHFDPVTDWYLMAWDLFGAAEFPADEARKLAISLGLDLDRLLIKDKKLLRKKGSFVKMRLPWERGKKGMVDPDMQVYSCLLDAAHTAMMLYKQEGAQHCETFLEQADLLADDNFRQLMQALLFAIPRTRDKGKLNRPEAAVIEDMRLAFFDELEVPPDPDVEAVQGELGLDQE